MDGDISAFDAPFFSIPPLEATSMDPQQRLMLETAYQAFENAGISMDKAAGSNTSCYVGSSTHEYDAIQSRDPDALARYLGTGVGGSLISNRVSWFYNLKGPSLTIDTACSSSLSALHLAVQSLREGESDMALAGGVNVMLAPDQAFMYLSNMTFLSPDGRSYSFDSKGNGYAKGEGAGLVVIKRLSDALRDGDTIRSVIRASTSNQDGRTPGITQPSGEAQELNILNCYNSAGLDFEKTQYFEAHGTGTQVGDPIEAGAIARAFKRPPENPLYVGSVKASIGHLEAGAGVAGLIKTCLVLEKGLIPPQALYEKPNVKIPLDEWNIRFPSKPTPWPTEGLRRASLSSFGYGGTNVHLVLEDACHFLAERRLEGKHRSVVSSSQALTNGIQTNGTNETTTGNSKVFVLSAQDEAGVKRLASEYETFLARSPKDNTFLEDLAFTLSDKRSKLPWKSFVVADSVDKLTGAISSDLSKPLRSSAPPRVSFVFTGQGAQWYAMGRELKHYPVFAASLKRSERVLKAIGCPWSLTEELAKDKKTSRIDDAALSQPVCSALQLALVDLLSSWNVHPIGVVGHSSGEMAAAYCAGGLSFDSCLKAAYWRGALASTLAETTSRPGAMASIAMSAEEIGPHLQQSMKAKGGQVFVGCVNSPTNVTVSGDAKLVEALVENISDQGIFARKLKIKGLAYHSLLMEQIAAEYLSNMEGIGARETAPGEPLPTMFSSVYGTAVSPEEVSTPQYWVKNMTSTVRFTEAVSLMTQNALNIRKQNEASGTNKDIFLEVGPHSALRRPVKDTVAQVKGSTNVIYDSLLERDNSATLTSLSVVGRLWCNGLPVDLVPVNAPQVDESALTMLTNLPKYPFNHANNKFWSESRISKNFRFRHQPRHELLGAPVLDWNPLEPRWRNIIKMSENPWLQHHKMDGTVIYPASGMLVMAIEAARQLVDPSWKVTGYRLEKLQFLQALKIPSGPEGAETEIFLHQLKGSGPHAKHHDFAIYVHLNDSWQRICNGIIITEIANDSIEVDDGLETNLEHGRVQELFQKGVKTCNESVESGQFYKNLASYGQDFGPSHQAMTKIAYNQTGESKASVGLDSWLSKVDSDVPYNHLIHPTALDGVLQTSMAAFTNGSWKQVPTMVPTNIKSIWLSSSMAQRKPDYTLDAYCKINFRGYREADFWIAALDSDMKPQIVVDDFRQMAVTNLESFESDDSKPRQLCFTTDWKPDIEMLSPKQLTQHCEAAAKDASLPAVDVVEQAELVTLCFMSDALDALKSDDLSKFAPHHQKYIEWMKQCVSPSKLQAQAAKVPNGQKVLQYAAYKEQYMNEFAQSGSQGALSVTIGRELLKILRNERDPLDLLFQSKLTGDFYHGPPFQSSFGKMASLLDLMAHKTPNLRVLEVGAGSAGATVPIVQALGSHGDCKEKAIIPRFDKYVFTDISASFFDDAKALMPEHEQRMKYQTLDIEKDLKQQGYEDASFDVVVCSLVLHATTNISAALSNAKKLLRPGGKLVILEPTNTEVTRVSFIFGLLAGWWQGVEENRKAGPCLKAKDWDTTLSQNGFTGAEVSLPDYSEPTSQTYSVIITSSASEPEAAPSLPTTHIVIDGKDQQQQQLAKELSASIQKAGASSVKTVSTDSCGSTDFSESNCVVLTELEKSWLSVLTPADFEALKKMTIESSGLLWVTRGSSADKPQQDLVTGFARNARSENPTLNFIHLDLDSTTTQSGIVEQVTSVYQKNGAKAAEDCESEIKQHNGMYNIGRVVESEEFNRYLYGKATRLRPQDSSFGKESDRALRLNIAAPGLLDTFHWMDDAAAEVPLPDNEIEINTKAVGMNFKDVLISLGNLPGSAMGFECAGIVSRASPQTGYKPGDRVCAMTMSGTFKTHVRASPSNVVKMGDELSFPAAAALPLVYGTAYYSLYNIGRLEEGESILIHSGAGGVGQAAIQLAQLRKAKVFTTAGTNEKKKFLMKTYGIPAEHIFTSRNTSFAQAVKRLTNGEGVDVILNSVSQDNFRASWSCIATFGRFVEIGKTDINSGRGLPMEPFLRNVTFSSVDLSFVMNKNQPLMNKIMVEMMKLVKAGSIRPPEPLQVYSVSEVEAAFRSLASGKSLGKITINMDPNATIPVSTFFVVAPSMTILTLSTDYSNYKAQVQLQPQRHLRPRRRSGWYRPQYGPLHGRRRRKALPPPFPIRPQDY